MSDAGAILSPCGTYRYALWRSAVTADTEPGSMLVGTLLWVMLNPSTAEATDESNDPTVRKVIGFTHRWGFANARVVNLWALRSTDWRALRDHADPIGPENDQHILDEARSADAIIYAWGAHAPDVDKKRRTVRATTVLRMIERVVIDERIGDCPTWTLGATKSGAPEHPLMVPYARKRACT